MRPHSLFQFCLAIICLCALSAHADNFTTFALGGNYSALGSTYQLSGTVLINTTTGNVVSVNFDHPQPYGGTDYETSLLGGPFLNTYEINESFGGGFSSANYYDIDLFLPTNSLVGYAGGDLCSLTLACPFNSGDPYGVTSTVGLPHNTVDVNSASLTALGTSTSPTPEPSSFLLLGTGVVTVAGSLRRRL